MTAVHGIWRRGLLLWLPALLFFVANLVALGVYQARFAGRTEVSEEELAAAQQELEVLGERRQQIEQRLVGIDTTRQQVEDFYSERLAPESVRLTRVIAEVKDLASRSGLQPRSISYPQQVIEDYGLRQRSLVFRVEGSYADLRKLVNLLEISESFLTLEQVSLSGRGGAGLSIQLRVSTLFAIDGQDPLAGELEEVS
jgi:Tfp pilus assembly protein PilO